LPTSRLVANEPARRDEPATSLGEGYESQRVQRAELTSRLVANEPARRDEPATSLGEGYESQRVQRAELTSRLVANEPARRNESVRGLRVCNESEVGETILNRLNESRSMPGVAVTLAGE